MASGGAELPTGLACSSSPLSSWPGAWDLGPLYRIIYIITFAIIKGDLVEDIVPTRFAAAAWGLAPWPATGCRLPSGATMGASQAFLLTALFA